MKRGRVPLKVALYAALLVAMVFSAMQLYVPKAKAYGLCCRYTSDCPDRAICCKPPLGAAPCSQTLANYCLSACESSGE
jgi:hypothetical protein